MVLKLGMNIKDIMRQARSIIFSYEDCCKEDISDYKVRFTSEELILESPDHTCEYRVPLSFIAEDLRVEDRAFKFGPFEVR